VRAVAALNVVAQALQARKRLRTIADAAQERPFPSVNEKVPLAVSLLHEAAVA